MKTFLSSLLLSTAPFMPHLVREGEGGGGGGDGNGNGGDGNKDGGDNNAPAAVTPEQLAEASKAVETAKQARDALRGNASKFEQGKIEAGWNARRAEIAKLPEADRKAAEEALQKDIDDAKKKADDAKAESDKKRREAMAPKDYSTLKAQDGWEIDAKQLEKYTPRFKALGIDPVQAQGMVDMLTEIKAEEAKAWEAQVDGWAKASKEDKEIGGANYETTTRLVDKLVKTYGTPELSGIMNGLGVGNHPELVRFAARIAKTFWPSGVPKSEGQVGDKGGGSKGFIGPGETSDAAKVLFGSNDK